MKTRLPEYKDLKMFSRWEIKTKYGKLILHIHNTELMKETIHLYKFEDDEIYDFFIAPLTRQNYDVVRIIISQIEK